MHSQPAAAWAIAGEDKCGAGVGGTTGAPLAGARVRPHAAPLSNPSGGARSRRPRAHRRRAAAQLLSVVVAELAQGQGQAR